MNCHVCLDPLFISECVRTKCNHYFHRICLLRWLQDRHTCPYCRGYIYKNECKLLNHLSMIHLYFENGLNMNDRMFFPKNLYDLKLCFMYLFYNQTGILLSITKTMDNNLNRIIKHFLDHLSHDMNMMYMNFYHQKDLEIIIKINEISLCRIDMKDIHHLFHRRHDDFILNYY